MGKNYAITIPAYILTLCYYPYSFIFMGVTFTLSLVHSTSACTDFLLIITLLRNIITYTVVLYAFETKYSLLSSKAYTTHYIK